MTVSSNKIPLGEYIFLRICQANPRLKSIFGVPGDYNLNLMEHLYSDSLVEKNIKFVGNCNELNAAYCSDGYARILDTFSVMISTLGVGELSAMNGISSAFSEFSPILHIVGSIPIFKEKANETKEAGFENWHHLVQNKDQLQPPDCDVYQKMCEPISICNEKLTLEGLKDDSNFEKIDNLINQILCESRPGYLFVPADLPDIKVSSDRLNEPFPFRKISKEGEQKSNQISTMILNELYNSSKPSIMADDLITKFHGLDSFNNIINNVSNNKAIKLYSSRIGKLIDETLDNFIGVYPSANKKVIESFQADTDLLIIFGYTNFETNALYNSMDHFGKIKTVIKINPDYVQINQDIYNLKSKQGRMVLFSELVKQISHSLDTNKLPKGDNISGYKSEILPLTETEDDTIISQNKLFNFANNYIQEGDIIMTETSSFSFGLPDLLFKKNVRAIYNSYYASIGFALPACLGVSMALRDLGIKNRRVLLFEGDGSAQMTVQELSTFLRWEVTTPTIFLMNNQGYTIERAIKGETRSYNDIQPWNWKFALSMFGDSESKVSTYQSLTNGQELDNYFKSSKNDKLEILEIIMNKTDYSNGLKFFLGK